MKDRRRKHFKAEEDISGEGAGKVKGQNGSRAVSALCLVWISLPMTGSN